MNANIKGSYLEEETICAPILRSLPELFGIEKDIIHYSIEIDKLPTWLAYGEERVVGFVSAKQHTPYSAVIFVMGILSESHRKGNGKALINSAQGWLKSHNIEYFQVKTLGYSRSDAGYARTRAFYEAMGF